MKCAENHHNTFNNEKEQQWTQIAPLKKCYKHKDTQTHTKKKCRKTNNWRNPPPKDMHLISTSSAARETKQAATKLLKLRKHIVRQQSFRSGFLNLARHTDRRNKYHCYITYYKWAHWCHYIHIYIYMYKYIHIHISAEKEEKKSCPRAIWNNFCYNMKLTPQYVKKCHWLFFCFFLMTYFFWKWLLDTVSCLPLSRTQLVCSFLK